MRSFDQRRQMRKNSIFKEYPVRNVGPVVMSGRVTDIAVREDKPRIFYVGFASGGIFKTENNGNTMKPIFDHQGGTLTIGDIAISKADKNTIWVGTGEKNSSRSSYAGAGVYKSTDGGDTWQYVGLPGAQHIGRIITHPENPDIAWVASMGPLYSMNDERGVYKTTDGGKSWKKTLTPPDSTGVIDLVMDPQNPNKIWATTWQRFRQAWNFKEAGSGSAIYVSVDGGESWQKSMQGFPRGEFVGRIGIGVSQSNPNIMYAFLDNQEESKTPKKEKKDILTQADFLKMTRDAFLKLDNDKLNDFLRKNSFPKKYSAESVKHDVKEGKYEPKALSDYLGDANNALFDTSIKGAEVYRSENGGQSWKKINSYELEKLIYTYGYYFGEIRVSPTDPDVLYIMGVPMLKSTDGGKTWKPMAENQNVHVDHHAMWIDPADSQHLLLGNDGGLYESHDGGENFIHHNVAPVGQFYSVAVDMEKPYNIYGGLQDNGVFMGSSQGSPNDEVYWKRIFGGDGMHVAVNPQNSDIIYTGFQFGNYYRIDKSQQSTERITPKPNIGEDPYRFNWNTPIEMSNHNPDILYFGSQKISRSLDEGKTWTAISPDLTNDLPNGNVPYSTITTISESPLDFSVIWAGTDDGNIQVTRDGGSTWELVSENLPRRRWVSEVQASPHDPGTAYASLNGYRFDEFRTYLYKTSDYGKTWKSVKGNLPESVANVIVQDPVDPNILYAGLDHGTYISFNDGGNWFLVTGIPNVPAYDMVVHPRDYELVVGTHGRSVYVMDVKPLHRVAKHLSQTVLALKTENVQYSNSWGERSAPYREVNEPEVAWLYWIGDKKVHDQQISITIKDKDGKVVKELTDNADYGFNTFNWNLLVAKGKSEKPGTYLTPGKYNIIYNINGSSDSTTFEIISNDNNKLDDERVLTSPEEFERGE
jgi:photosystem II stability/assembly factor-like uncharacterized protein